MITIQKTDVVRARIESDVKKDAEGILKRLGVSHSTFINMSYRAVVENDGIPFPLTVPNAQTKKAIAEGRARKGTTASSVASFRKSLRAL
jgi:DNA-damage-inducible protein J